MKRLFLLAICLFCFVSAQCAYLKDVPMTLTQPDGTILKCFASGDEFFNYLHDANGYTIIMNPETGFYVYAQNVDGKLVATDIVAGTIDPATKGLSPHALISPKEWINKRKQWNLSYEQRQARSDAANHGTLNNIVIFIRFADDGEFVNTYSSIHGMFNDSTANAISMYSYFRAASYGAITIPTYFYPGHNGETVISYQDTQNRSYFQPYNASTNPNGYQDDNESTEREHALLKRAVDYVENNHLIPNDLNIDYDNDGCVDNVCFIVRGNVGAWSSLLWPHQWALYSCNAFLNGKRVWTYNFQLADATRYFNTSTMCHEMNHSLGAPDLYHYSYSGPTPVGPWDLMQSNATPPQHCGAYMKWKYGNWIDEIPEITEAGTYTLNPISSATPTNVAYKIASDVSGQYYVLEYRDKTSTFEAALPGSGLLIYRIDTRFQGNAGYDPSSGVYDEVYIYRPNGTTVVDGNIYYANFSSNSGRTSFNSTTNPYPFYTDGTIDQSLNIYNVTSAGNTISFTYGSSSSCQPPTGLTATVDGQNVTLNWNAAENAVSYAVFRDGELLTNSVQGTSFLDEDLPYGTYHYYVKSMDVNGLMSSSSNIVDAVVEYPTPKVDDLVGVIGDDNVQLTWSAPDWCYPEYETASLYYTLNWSGYSVGYNGIYQMYWGHRYPISMLEPYTNKSIYKVSFYSNEAGDYQLFVYQGTDSSKPSTLLRNMSIAFTETGWCEFVLDEPIIIDGTKDIWVFIYDPVYRSYPACYSSSSEPTNGSLYTTSPLSYTYVWESGAFLIQTFLTDGTYTYNLYDGATKIAENLSDTHYLVENPSGNTMHNYAVKTNYYGGETNPSNYVGLTLGNATVDNLELTSDDKMVISENGILNVSGTLANSNPANLILEDGAQLVNNSTGVKATVRHSITGYDGGEAKDGGTTIPAWNLIASPFVENITPSAENGLCTDNYDLYRFNQDADLQWENAKSQSFAMENKVGYLYASEEDADVELAGTLAMAASEGVAPLTYTAGKPLAGWNLVGNPYPCNAYPSQSYYTLSADGTSVNPNMTTDAVPPCSAILVKADAANQSVSFSKTEPRRDYGNIVIKVFNENGTEVIGRAMVCINAGLMSSLQRFPVDNAESKLYLLHDGKEYVITDVEDDVNQQISICFATKNVGNYLISFDMDKLNGKQVVVVDDLTGESRCLSEKTSSFVFAASPDDHPVRFRLLLNNK